MKLHALPALLLALPLLAGCEDLVYFPARIGPEQARAVSQRHAAHAEEFRVETIEGVTLHGWLARGAGSAPRPLVIYFGGNAEEVSWLLDRIDAFAGWTVALINYRGYGRSEGRPSQRALFADALAVYDRLVQRPDVDQRRIVAMGRSLGSGIAVHLASQRPLAGVILVSPFDSATAVARSHYPLLPDWVLGSLYNSAAVAARIVVPLQMIVAEDDDVIPPVHSRRLYEVWGGTKQSVSIAGAGHNDLHLQAVYWRTILEFLAARSETAAK
jgi:hypothetical protein